MEARRLIPISLSLVPCVNQQTKGNSELRQKQRESAGGKRQLASVAAKQ